MAELGIDHLARRLPVETSLGEQQRAAVARALVAEPRLVMADEPTSHQDEPNAMRVLDVLERTAAAGGMVVLATHDPRIVERCHHVVALRDGRVVADELGRV